MPVSLHEYSNVGATEIIREGIRRVTLVVLNFHHQIFVICCYQLYIQILYNTQMYYHNNPFLSRTPKFAKRSESREKVKPSSPALLLVLTYNLSKGAAKKYQFGSTKVFNIKIDMSVSASGNIWCVFLFLTTHIVYFPRSYFSPSLQSNPRYKYAFYKLKEVMFHMCSITGAHINTLSGSFKFHKMKQVSHVAAGNHVKTPLIIIIFTVKSYLQANYDMLGFVAKSEFKERFL